MADQAIQNKPSAELQTWKQSYESSWAKAAGVAVLVISEQYRLELTEAFSQMWKRALSVLTPKQIEEGLANYMATADNNFPPIPGQIIAAAPPATDRPRPVVDPNCPTCGGSGWAPIANRVRRCDCRRIEYDGHNFLPAPAKPLLGEGEMLERLKKKLPPIPVKTFPVGRDLNFDSQREKLERQKQALLQGAK